MKSDCIQIMEAIPTGGTGPRWRGPNFNSSRRDLLCGLVVSLLFHGLLLFGHHLWPRKPKPVVKPPPEEAAIQLAMPPLEQEKLDEVVELQDSAPPEQFAPPQQQDVPVLVPLNAFTQPIQPPAPTGIVKPGLTAIPLTRPGSGFGQGIGNVFDSSNLDQRPVLKTSVAPDYPFQMRQQALPGKVAVEFIIDTEGNVVAVRVMHSSNEAFELPAVKAVQRWKFKPGRKGGRVVNTRVQQLITFNLEKE